MKTSPLDTNYILLWSPSAYAACEGEQIAQWIMECMEEGMKNPIKIDLVKIMEGNENGNT